MKTKQFVSIGAFVSLLCSCATSGGVRYDIEEYKTDLEWKEGFTVCQLNDLHLSTLSNLDEEFEYYGKLVKANDGKLPDFIVLNGDAFMDANQRIVDRTVAFFDSLGVPFAFTYGNHDTQGFYSDNYINKKMLESEKSVYKNPNSQGRDDVFGNSNYFVNLKAGNDLKWKLIFMDSNSYYDWDYDAIHDDQVEWYERAILESSGHDSKPALVEDGTFVKSLLFFHIPTPEFETATTAFKNNYPDDKINEDQYCDVRESISSGANKHMNKNIIDTIQEYRSTVSIGVAHDHINNTDLRYLGEGDWPVHLIYGMKSSQGIYHNKDIMGAAFYTLLSSKRVNSFTNDVYFDLKFVSLQYNQESSEGVTLWSTSNY